MSACIDRRDFLKAAGIAAACTGMVARRAAAAEACPGASAADKLGWRLGCAAYSFNRLTFYETIGKVSALGLKEVVGFNWQGLDPAKPGARFGEAMSAAERQETKKRLSDAGVKLAACYCRAFTPEDACRRFFDFAKEMGIEIVEGEPPLTAFDVLEKLCDEYQLILAVHNHAKPSQYWNPQTLMKIFQGRGPRIGACCDTGHWGRSGLQPVETLATLQGRIIAFDLKDVNEQGQCVPFGTGKSDIRAILKEMQRQKFRGLFSIEYDQRSPNLEADIRQCIEFFSKTAQELAPTG